VETARIFVQATVNVNTTKTVNASKAWMGNPHGQGLTAHSAHAPRILLGLEVLSMLTTYTLGLNVPIKVCATAKPELANALPDTMELLAKDLSALTTVTSAASAGQKCCLLQALDVFTLFPGMLPKR